jgi:hypothetical protein
MSEPHIGMIAAAFVRMLSGPHSLTTINHDRPGNRPRYLCGISSRTYDMAADVVASSGIKT